jgi:hypothetical protein
MELGSKKRTYLKTTHVQGKTVNFRQKPKDKNNIMSPTAMETEGSTRLFVPNSTEIEHKLVFGVDL